MRHAGRAVDDRPQALTGSSGAALGAAVLDGRGGVDRQDPRFTSGARLTPAFGLQVGNRRSGHSVPAFGTPEHFALMSGSLDLDAIEQASHTGPLVGFAPVVLDPRGPRPDDLLPSDDEGGSSAAPGTCATRVLPTRRSLRTSTASPRLGRPLSGAMGSGVPLPSPRALTTTSLPPATPGSSAALRVQDVEEALAAVQAAPRSVEDPTPTGELARPFVSENASTPWNDLADVPPPVSVDVFQRAVRAGLALDDPESLKKALDDQDTATRGRGRSARSRRELRARERVANSPRSVAARRLAKGGVLAITALGVVSSATPQGLAAFGLKDGGTTHNTVDFKSAIAPDVTAPELTTAQLEQIRQASLSGHLSSELADARAASVTSAGIQAGVAAAQLGFERDEQVRQEKAARWAAYVRDAQRNPQAVARFLMAEHGWGAGQYQCLVKLWNRESGWNYRATNPSSNAYGIPQSLPGSKMNTVGSDWRTNPVTQIKWGLNYIEERYGTPCGAWAHSEAYGNY